NKNQLELFEKSSEEREKKKIRALNSFRLSSSSPTTMVRQPKSEVPFSLFRLVFQPKLLVVYNIKICWLISAFFFSS
ncbi:unnamed protein product, partial [Prunus brigantina]